jgi:tRNA 2-thiouridine synthesizing protein A
MHLVDGGNKACGELLMELVAPMRALPAGEVVRLVATDPAAPLDVPAWCHLTRHGFLGAGTEPDGRPHYDLQVSADPQRIQLDRPWRREPLAASPSTPEGRSRS